MSYELPTEKRTSVSADNPHRDSTNDPEIEVVVNYATEHVTLHEGNSTTTFTFNEWHKIQQTTGRVGQRQCPYCGEPLGFQPFSSGSIECDDCHSEVTIPDELQS